MSPPQTLSEALWRLGKMCALLVMAITAIWPVITYDVPDIRAMAWPILVFLNLFFTAPVALLWGARLMWSRLLWSRAPRQGLMVVGNATTLDRPPLLLSDLEREGHVGIFGATRSGKSTLAESMASQDILSGRPTIVMDPHGSMVEALSAQAINSGRVPCLIQATDERLPTLNLLQTEPGYSAYDAARTVAEGLSNVYIPFQEELPVRLRNTLETAAYFLARANEGYTIIELPRFILQPGFRDYLAKKVAEEAQGDGWLEPEHALTSLAWLESLTRTQRYQQTQSVWTRLAGLLSAPDSRRMFGASTSTFAFGELLQGAPLLIALQRERLHHGAHLANGMVLTWLTHRLRTRSPQPDGFYSPIFVYLDELSEVSPAVFESLLLVAGKRAVRLTLIVQSHSMLDGRLRQSLMGNLNTRIVLQSSGPGVNELCEDVFVPPSFDPQVAFGGPPTSRLQQKANLAHRIRSLPQYHFVMRSATQPNVLRSGRCLLAYRVSPLEADAARKAALQAKGLLPVEIDSRIRERFRKLNARFGPLQDYGDDQLLHEMAPW